MSLCLFRLLLQPVVFFTKSLVLGFSTLPLFLLVDQIATTCADRGAPCCPTATTEKSARCCADCCTGSGALLGLCHCAGADAKCQRYDEKHSQGNRTHIEERYSSRYSNMHI